MLQRQQIIFQRPEAGASAGAALIIAYRIPLVKTGTVCYNEYSCKKTKRRITEIIRKEHGMYYYIRSTLEKAEHLNFTKKNSRYVAVLTSAEWLEHKDQFDMGIEMDMDLSSIHSTKAEVNYDSLTGTFSIPDRQHISAPNTNFAFALDEKGIVFIDDSGFVEKQIESIIAAKRWAMPSLERFLFDFLEQIIAKDQVILEQFDKEGIESGILEGADNDPSLRVSRIRSDLRDLRNHYEQLLDLSQELEENENNFFKKENIRYFHLYAQRVSRLHDLTNSLREFSIQIRDLYQSQLDIRQNRIMALLTVISSIFMPLTLIAGWYGMNFRYMPELNSPLGYPVVIAVSVLIVIFCLVFFKKKNWL